MKQLTLKLIIPLSVISFATLTKWWYALPVDAPGTYLTGFPFPFVCNGWHTSMSLQIFAIEFFVDFLTYFLIWFLVFFCINRYWRKINPTKWLTIFLWSVAGLIICGASFIAANPDHKFYLKRPFDMEVKASGFRFIWEKMERMDNQFDDGQVTKTKNTNIKNQELTIDTFSNFPPEIDGCSCYYSKDSLDLKNESYLYANDFEQSSFLKINGILTKFIQSEWKELNKTTRTAKAKSADYELTIEIHDVRKNGDETWINTGTITVKDKNGNKTTRTLYGECGC